MKAKSPILLLFSLLILSHCYDDLSVVKTRLNFYNQISKYSNDSISVGVSVNEGLSCVANEDLLFGRRHIKVPIRETICPYYVFPFKFEIVEALKTLPQIVQSVGSEQKFGVFLLTYYVLYLLKADKALIKNYINENKIQEYMNITDIDERLIESFPKVILGGATLDPDQYVLLRELGYPIDKEFELDQVFRTVSIWVNANSPHAEFLFPWISDIDSFRYAYGIVMSRGMSLKLPEYKILFDIHGTGSMTEVEKRNFEINNFFARVAGAPCIVVFIDLCNHYQPKFVDMRDKHAIILDTEKGYFVNSVPVDFKAGEALGFTYSNEPSNLILFLHYGFIIPKNIFNIFKVRVEDDFVFTINQFNLCRELGCLDSSIKDPLKVPKVRMYNVRYGEVTQELVNLARIKYLKGEVNYGKILRTLTNERPISAENEIRAWSYYLSHMRMTQFSRLPLEKSVLKIQKYRNKRINFERNWNKKNQDDLKLWKRLKHFELIFGIDLTYRGVILYQQTSGLKNVIKNLKNNINELKMKKYLKNK